MNSRTAAAKRSVGQRLAGPYSAPGQRPIRGSLGAGLRRGARGRWRIRGDRRPAESGQLQVAFGLVSARLRRALRDALEQPATPVAGITDHGGDAEGARLEGGAQRVGEKKGRVETCPDPPGQGARRFPGWISITSSTAGTRRQSAANLAGVRMVRWRSGRPRRQASTAGILITASPSQLLERTKSRKGCSPPTAFASGGWNPRRALPRRKGPGFSSGCGPRTNRVGRRKFCARGCG